MQELCIFLQRNLIDEFLINNYNILYETRDEKRKVDKYSLAESTTASWVT